MDHISEGQLITAPFLPSKARVKKFEDKGAFHLLEVTLEDTGEYRSLRLPESQVREIEIADRRPEALTENPEEFFLLVESKRIRLAHQFDPRLAVSVSQVDPLPHQIEAVYHHALEMPRLRFLIADDPGAGKTIMAGLILKEMQARRLVQDVLIVAPGHLKYQWQREMKEKFNLQFRLIDRGVMRAAWGENVWDEFSHAVTSIDFIKQDDIKSTIGSTQWDLVIVDEAHKMAAYAYETQEGVKTDKTKRYQVGEVLSERSDHLLFLTATPHKGDEENFRLFLDLLRPGFFAKTELLEESVERGENPIFIRRLKEDMRTFEGQPIFPPRHVHTVQFRMTDPEIRLYNAVTRYVKNYWDQAKENRHITFAMIILQRRLTSSVHAVLSSLQRRREKLEQFLKLPEKIGSDEQYEGLKGISEEELADMEEEERDEIERKLEQLTIAENIDEVKAEISELRDLIEHAEDVRAQEVESKLNKLRDDILSVLRGRKLLIFTEHKDTLWYLTDKLKDWGYSVCVIHGGMSLDARIDAEKEFRDEAQIMVATEAAGEGINLQFCSLMVNYDIPWNPNRLEQRMGRIHRYGQDREVHIWNLISKDTREGVILDKLFEKLERMRKALGTDRVFDVIGEVVPGGNLTNMLRDAVLNQRRMEEIEGEIEAVDEEETGELLDQIFMTSLASRHIDYTGLEREQLEAEERQLVPEYVRDFFLRAFSRLDGRLTKIDDGYRIDHVPYELRRVNDDYDFKTTYGKVYDSYRRITFQKQVARRRPEYEFVAPGHPLLESLNEAVLTEFDQDADAYAVFEDPEGEREGVLWFMDGVVRDGRGKAAGRRVFALFQNGDDSLVRVNPAILWDLEPVADREASDALVERIEQRESVEDHFVTEVLLPYRDEVAERRQQDARIKKRYGLRSLDYLISESNSKILEYQDRADEGEDMDLAIRREQRRLEQLQQRKDDLETEIRLESNLTVEEPSVLGVAAVVPALGYEEMEPRKKAAREGEEQPEPPPGGGQTMQRDEEIERIGMQVARAYEEDQGRRVEDVSDEPHGGFDLRSLKVDEDGGIADVRYIEVKARARSGEIRLTSNEWKKARHFGTNYWLYVVTNAGTESPDLRRISNPAAQFQKDEDIFATGYKIPEDRWQSVEETEKAEEQGAE